MSFRSVLTDRQRIQELENDAGALYRTIASLLREVHRLEDRIEVLERGQMGQSSGARSLRPCACSVITQFGKPTPNHAAWHGIQPGQARQRYTQYPSSDSR